VADDASATITIVLGASFTGVSTVEAGSTAGATDAGRETDTITDPTTADKVRCG